MKNLASCGTRGHNSEITPLSRTNDLNRLMNYFWNYLDTPSASTDVAGEWEPHFQIAETKDAVTVTAELPGVEEKDLDLQISADGYLSVAGEKKNMSEVSDKDAYFSEITYGAFKRTIPLPWDLDYENAAAHYNNGVLTVSIPKSPDEKQKFKKITIQTKNN
jgi:HSP20 family protein